tara:strand:- start:1878 stop:2522 length:645 start_codon:yes stop_codon:yes gene_type:complete
MNKILSQFIPILILFLLLTYSHDFVSFSYTILGKLLALCIIIYYTMLDVKFGVLACALIIYYYQNEVIENMLNMDSIMDNLSFEKKDEEEKKKEECESFKCIEGNCNRKKKEETTIETMSNLNDIYQPNTKYEESLTIKNELKKKFKDEHCNGKILRFKNMDVKDDMTEHIFPEVKFEKESCNACDDTCSFGIIESKINTEKGLIPKFSKDELK